MATLPVFEPPATKANRWYLYFTAGSLIAIVAFMVFAVRSGAETDFQATAMAATAADVRANTQVTAVAADMRANTQATAMAATTAYILTNRQGILRSDLQQARTLWAARSLANYRLVIQFGPWFGPACEKVFEVAGAAQSETLSDTCDPERSRSLGYDPIDPRSVQDLFDYIEAEIGMVGECGPNGCDCDGRRMIDVVYDSDHGYPKKVEEREERFAPMQVQLTPCSAMGWILPGPFTVTVTPTPE